MFIIAVIDSCCINVEAYSMLEQIIITTTENNSPSLHHYIQDNKTDDDNSNKKTTNKSSPTRTRWHGSKEGVEWSGEEGKCNKRKKEKKHTTIKHKARERRMMVT